MMAANDVANWLSKRLQNLLGFDTTSVKDISDYMATITNLDELTAFTTELLFGNSGKNELDGPQKDFLKELQRKWQKHLVPENVIVYKKDEECSKLKTSKKINKSSKNTKNPFDLSNLNVPPVNTSPGKKAKKKSSYVSLYGKDGEMKTNAVVLPGRNACECQAQKHK